MPCNAGLLTDNLQTISAHITIRGASEWSSKARLDGQAHVGVDHLLTRKPAFCTRPLELARAHLLARASNHFPIMLVKYELLLVVLVRSACPGLMCVTMTSTFGTTPNLSAGVLPYVHQRALHGVPHLDRLEQAPLTAGHRLIICRGRMLCRASAASGTCRINAGRSAERPC